MFQGKLSKDRTCDHRSRSGCFPGMGSDVTLGFLNMSSMAFLADTGTFYYGRTHLVFAPLGNSSNMGTIKAEVQKQYSKQVVFSLKRE